MTFRVATVNVSAVDLMGKLATSAHYADTKTAMKAASEGPMKGIMGYPKGDAVSTDMIGEECTCVFEAKAGIASNHHSVKLIAWYDNEWGRSCMALAPITHMAVVDGGSGTTGRSSA